MKNRSGFILPEDMLEFLVPVNIKAEEMRIRYLYRDLVLRKKIRLPLEGAMKIVGPDCAYHLYSVSELNSPGGEEKRARGKKERA